jgi:hypothetical protein
LGSEDATVNKTDIVHVYENAIMKSIEKKTKMILKKMGMTLLKGALRKEACVGPGAGWERGTQDTCDEIVFSNSNWG